MRFKYLWKQKTRGKDVKYGVLRIVVKCYRYSQTQGTQEELRFSNPEISRDMFHIKSSITIHSHEKGKRFPANTKHAF